MQCATCKWFRSVNDEGGQCMNEPPKIFLVPVESVRGPMMQAAAFYPSVRGIDYCARHQPSLAS